MNPRRITCDFLCIGGGIGGLAAAVRAADLGMETVLLEKSGMLGGVAAYSFGHVWMGNNHLQESLGLTDSAADVLNYLAYATGGLPYDRNLRASYVEYGPEAIRYYADTAGIEFQIIRDFPDHYFPNAPGSKPEGRLLEVTCHGNSLGPWQHKTRLSPHTPSGLTRTEIIHGGGARAFENMAALHAKRTKDDFRTLGPGLAAAFVKAAVVDRQVKVMLGVQTERLLMNDDQVVGARCWDKDGVFELSARRGVLIATSSYGNAPYAASAEHLPEIFEASPPYLDGDNLRLADETPAAIVRAGKAFTVLGMHVPGETHPENDKPLYRQVFASLGYPHSIVVNASGQRFGDESYHGPESVKDFDQEAVRFRNYPCFLIVDDRYRKQYSIGPFNPGDDWSASFASARTIAALAEALGIDPKGLASTVANFNQGASRGADPEFKRGQLTHIQKAYGDPAYPNPNLGTLEVPPFWGIRLVLLGAGIYGLGIAIDGFARALRRNGEPVHGLYATGNATAHTDLPTYLGGNANARGIVFGYLAASHAAKARGS